jgi:hypothetical protein
MPVETSRPSETRRSARTCRTVLVLVASGIAGLLLLIAAERLQRPALIGPGLLLFAVGTGRLELTNHGLSPGLSP